MRSALKQHYHWLVAGTEFVVFAIMVGMANNMYNLYLIPVTTELGISRGVFSTAQSVSSLLALLSSLLFSIIYKRFGLRKTMSVFIVLQSLSYVGYSLAGSMLPFFAGAVIYGIGSVFTGTGGTGRMISSWFDSRRGTVMGIVMAASGLGGAILSIVLNRIITDLGWRASYAISAGMQFLMAGLVFFVLRDRPEELGLKPYVDGSAKKSEAAGRKTGSWMGIRMKELVRLPFFYLIMAATFLAYLSTLGYFHQIVPHLCDQGLDPDFAAAAYSVLMLCLAGAKILVGAISDRFGAHNAAGLCLLMNALGVALLAVCKTPVLAICCMFLLAFGLCTQGFMTPLIASEMFGEIPLTAAIGIMLAISSVSGLVASPAANFTFDRLGSYTPVFFVLMVISLISAALYLIAYRQLQRWRSKTEAKDPV